MSIRYLGWKLRMSIDMAPEKLVSFTFLARRWNTKSNLEPFLLLEEKKVVDEQMCIILIFFQ